MKKLILLMLSVLFLIGCTEETEKPERKAPVISAGEDRTAKINETVQINDATASDPDGDQLTIHWTFSSKPAGSAATIVNETAIKASFTPDVAGTYIMSLTVNDGNENPVTDQVTILVEEPTAYILSDDVLEDLTIYNIFDDPSIPDCKVTGDIGVYAKLIVEPGVIVEFENETSLNIESPGTLLAVGETDNRIIFTGKNKTKGYWKGILMNSASEENNIAFSEINYAGSAALEVDKDKANLFLKIGSKLSLSNTTISNGNSFGMVVEDGCTLLNFADNVFSENSEAPVKVSAQIIHQLDGASAYTANNGRDAVEVMASDIEDSETEYIWPTFNDGTHYLLLGKVNVHGKLKISAGAILDFNPEVGLYIGSTGYLIAKGTADLPIVFTGKEKTVGYWQGITIYSENEMNEFDYVEISYAGSTPHFESKGKANLFVAFQSKLKLNNSLISEGGGYGMIVEKHGVLMEFSQNEFKNNATYPISLAANMVGKLDKNSIFSTNGRDKVEIIESELANTQVDTWKFLQGADYHVSGNLSIHSGLIIEAGSNFEFASDVLFYIGNTGYVSALGGEMFPIGFTASDKSGTGNWRGIDIYSSSELTNTFQYVDVSYGGKSEIKGYLTNIMLDFGSKLNMSNANIYKSAGWGIVVKNNEGFIPVDLSYNNNTTGDLLDLTR